MKTKISLYNQSIPDTYENTYLDLPFENMLRLHRKKRIIEQLTNYSHGRFLEVGSGPDPLFKDFTSFDHMTIVEPGKMFYEMNVKQAGADSKITVINDFIENIDDKLKEESFDFIVLGGFLHEVEKPEIVLKAVREICSESTIVYSFVPNARSFHRLLAYEMGIIDSIYVNSGRHNELLLRKKVYDLHMFDELLTSNGFKVIESGSYFIKPFTHDQMHDLMRQVIIDKAVLDGLDRMIKYLPDLGAEIWNICSIDD